ncbi:hypothetical protein LshimejAT787_0312260 [Lyophyllum shimeji]|uniref:C2H2-type domain-containing protein n=1 Tax=Lyophyllum shimeji TaxID=47721 RepID=A0A9P3UJG3_LYOSH|nr:hypothetical protein LshimejAT787_0312260 [Lyophyllum shimeji]
MSVPTEFSYIICPACSLLFTEEEAMLDHLPTHNDDPILAFISHGRVYVINRNPVSRRFKCPLQCSSPGGFKPEDLYHHLSGPHGQEPTVLSRAVEETVLHPCLFGRAHLRSSTAGPSLIPAMQKGKRKADDSPPTRAPPPRTPMTPASLLKPTSLLPRHNKQPLRTHVPSSPSQRSSHASSASFAFSSPSGSSTAIDSSPVPFIVTAKRASFPDSSPPQVSVATAAATSSPLVDLPIIPRSIFTSHPSGDDILKFIAPLVDNVIHSCVAHSVLGLQSSDSHRSLHAFHKHVSEGVLGLLVPSAVRVVWPWRPGRAAVRRRGAPGFLAAVPYLVWRCQELRTRVFSFLCVNAEALSTTDAFTRWLMAMSSVDDRRISNLVALVYAYFVLRKDGLLEGGYSLDATTPL